MIKINLMKLVLIQVRMKTNDDGGDNDDGANIDDEDDDGDDNDDGDDDDDDTVISIYSFNHHHDYNRLDFFLFNYFINHDYI